MAAGRRMAALFTRASSPPPNSTAAAIAVAHWPSSLTSRWT